jgi:hypothetical protein
VRPSDPELDDWCEEYLGSAPRSVLFRIEQVSSVIGLRLRDGREVVVKVRPDAERIRACVFVQRYAFDRGFPCAEPVAGPALLGEQIATAETYVPNGETLDVNVDGAPALYAAGLARLVGLVPAEALTTTLEPPPYWMNWDHSLAATWSPDPNVDLNARSGPEWLERAGRLARERLRGAHALPAAIGHGDWESQNLRWRGRELYVAHDWDSAVRRPEALIAGMTSLIFPSTGTRNEAASIAQSEAFLDAYQGERQRRFSRDELELAWAAGLWLGAWKAKKALLFGDRDVMTRLESEAAERLRRMGA